MLSASTKAIGPSKLRPESPKSYSYYISEFCNFYSYLCIFPFRIVRVGISDELDLCTSKLRKALCAAVHVLVVVSTTGGYFGLACLRIRDGWGNPSDMFLTGTPLLCFMIYFSDYHILWSKSEEIIELASLYSKTICRHGSLCKFLQIGILCLTPMILVLADNPLLTSYKEVLVKLGYVDGVLCSGQCQGSEQKLLVACDLIISASMQFAQLFFIVGTTFLLALVLPVKFATDEYGKRLRSLDNLHPVDSLMKAVKAESDMRKLISKTNSVVSGRMTWEYVLMVVFYATIFDFFIRSNRTELEKLNISLYLILSGLFWIFACEIHYQVRNITKDWLQDYQSKLSPEFAKTYEACLLSLQSECDLNPAGISCRFFVVTYGFLGSMIGLILTYATLAYQLKSDSSQCPCSAK